ncbi:hypothetical protein HOU39_gp108 [Lactobacillus phage Iacchus]|uniref:Uncharacterized protein n=1 Tax=Lactobacillus phage Iacchus TaxID=2315483 RepID=A0A3Q8HZP3_9CAUD|nr:hypothetical protein HOU39_gp108 [Lactobacillus phage Iacchus]AYH92002.1 hypothetical protein [Lactobacillus phage Iacchus]AYH92174.1 hypothetical protein [Lactobacillus phage Dionysus]
MKFKEFMNHGKTENEIKQDIYKYGKQLDTIGKPANSHMQLYKVQQYDSGRRAVNLGTYDMYFQNIAELNLYRKPLVKLVSDGIDYVLYFQIIQQAILMDNKRNVKLVTKPSFSDFLGADDDLTNLFQNTLDKLRE